MKKYLIIKNAKQLLTLKGFSDRPKIKKEMADLGIIENGAIVCADERIVSVGKEFDLENLEDFNPKLVEWIDASGKVAMPGFIDCHTHLIFAGNRADEFSEKIKGTPYLEILAKGGGILSTVKKTRKALSENWAGLKEDCLKRMSRALKFGTTTMEAKSGYGLDLKSEMDILKMIDELNKNHPVDLVPTLLGAHTIPEEYKNNRVGYLNLIFKMIKAAKDKKLAEFCDVFCEKNAFSLSETRKILEAAKKAGLKLKIHAGQFNDLGAVELGVKLGATSIDHLEKISERGIKVMAKTKTIGVLLPGCEFHLGTRNYAPARKMIEAGVPIALASDFNPGSSPTLSIPEISALACRELNLTAEEIISAIMINAAHAISQAKEIGSLEPGKKADIIILDIGDYKELPYWFGMNPVCRVIKNGKVII